MARKRKHEFEKVIEDVLIPGVFIGWRDIWEFVESIEAVRKRISSLIKEGDAGRAVELFEIFIAGCYEKSEEIDDSGGCFGQVVPDLFSDWVRARQAAESDPDETAEFLVSWMQNDEYGYCLTLEKNVVKVLDRKGLSAFERAVHRHFNDEDKGSYVHRKKVEILKTILKKRRDVDGYVELCKVEERLTSEDCKVLAEMSLKRRRAEEALAWVDRGLDLEKEERGRGNPAWGLGKLKRQILKKLGRNGEALNSAWDDYRRSPSIFSYDELMKFVPKRERTSWHAKAIATLDRAGLGSRIALLGKTKELDRLAQTVSKAPREEFVALSHHDCEAAAKKLLRSHPLLAAKLHVAMALRIVEAKKSKHYDAALDHLEKARKIMVREGREKEWEALAAEIRNNHERKRSFMPGFERLAEGRRARPPSFRNRARRRWAQGARGRRRS